MALILQHQASNNLNAIVLLLRDKDSSILNGKITSFAKLGVTAASLQQKALSVCPNPASDLVNISFVASANMPARISATDITGRIIYHNELKASSPGRKVIQLNTSGWLSGIYFIRLDSGESQEIVKLNVIQ